MTQGEFIERLLDIDRIVSEQDIWDFVSKQSKEKKIPSLLALVKRECGWLFNIKESKFREVEEYRKEQSRRVSYLITCIKQQTNLKPRMLPDFLTERGMNAFQKSIEKGLIDKDSFEWLKSKAALSNWVRDINKVGGCSKNSLKRGDTNWHSFEKYFGVKGLASKEDKSGHYNKCLDYDDDLRKDLFPELPSSRWW